MFKRLSKSTASFDARNRYKILEMITDTVETATYSFTVDEVVYTTDGRAQVLQAGWVSPVIEVKTNCFLLILKEDTLMVDSGFDITNITDALMARHINYTNKINGLSTACPVPMMRVASKVIKGLRDNCISVRMDTTIHHMGVAEFSVRFNDGEFANYSNIEISGYYMDHIVSVGFDEGRFYTISKNAELTSYLLASIEVKLMEELTNA